MAADRLLALLLLLPTAIALGAGLFASGPWALGTGDPAPLATGAGLALLASLPALLAIALRTIRGPRDTLPVYATASFATIGLVAILAFVSGRITDTFEQDAGLAALALFAGGLIGGASLGREGARLLAIGLCGVALLAIAPALQGSASDAGWGGVLGNSGTLAHVALPGAAVGLGLVALGSRSLLALLGASAFAATLLHAYRAPVLATVVALLAVAALLVARGLGVGLRFGRRAEHTPVVRTPWPALLALVLLAAVAAPYAGPLVDTFGSTPTASAVRDDAEAVAPRADSALGGVGVRFGIWKAVPGLIASTPLVGVGPGQFQAAFVPYRDPGEIERSSLGRALPFETEVEHPHNDVLRAFAEYGVAGGLAWLLIAAAALLHGVRRALVADALSASLGVASAALAIAALTHSPLLGNALSASLAGAVFGSGFAPRANEPRGDSKRARSPRARVLPALLPWLVLIAALLCAPGALGLVQHGSAFVERARAIEQSDTALHAAARQELGPAQRAFGLQAAQAAADRASRALDLALEARPDSPIALGLAAREALRAGDVDRAGELNTALLSHRPHQIEGRVRRGLIEVRRGRVDAARATWRGVLELDRFQPAAAWNLVRLDLEHGAVADAREQALAFATAGRSVEPLWDLIAEAQLSGWVAPDPLATIVKDAGLFEVGVALPEALFGRATALVEAARDAPPGAAAATGLRAAGLESLAHALWAAQHIESGDGASARRSLRQALRTSRVQGRVGSPLVALELAAQELRMGAADAARGLLEESPPTPRALAAARADSIADLRAAGLLAQPAR